MQQICSDPYEQYARLLQAVQQQWQESYDQLQLQQIRHKELTQQHQGNVQMKHELKLCQIQLLSEIEKEKQRRISEIKLLLKRAEQHYLEQQEVQNIAKQSTLSIKIPLIKISLREMEEPKHFSQIIQEYKGDFQKQKAVLQQQIMKLKIVIRLNQIKEEEGLPTSKSKKSQTSNHPRR